MELKEENAIFLKRLNENTREDDSHGMKRYNEREEDISATDVKELLSQESIQDDNEKPPLKQKAFDEWNIKDQVLFLEEKGKSPEEIARKLNRGKTEIELLLKFRQ